MIARLVMLLIHLISATETKSVISYFVLDKQYSYTSASRACTKYNKYSFIPTLDCNMTELAQIMDTVNITSTWVAVHKKKLPSWQWVNGSTTIKSSTWDLSSSKETDRCAAVDVVTEKLLPYPCSAPETCYACNLPACDDTFRLCIPWHHHTVAVGYLSSSWFLSRIKCQKGGGDLAIIDADNEKKDFINDVVSRLPEINTKCRNIFIGLRLDHWMQSMSTGVARPVKHTMWRDGEPSNDDDFCAKLVMAKSNTIKLRSKDCRLDNTALCLFSTSQHKEDVIREIDVETCAKEKQEIHARNIVVWVTVTISSLLCLALIIILYIYKFQKGKACNDIRKRTDGCCDETIGLADK